MPEISGVLETCLYVEDLERSLHFYRQSFGFEPVFADDRMAALPVAPAQLLLLFRRRGTLEPVETPGGTIPVHDGSGPQHVAFAIPADALRSWEDRLRELDIRVTSRVQWSRGGVSLYFRDPDDHLVELATPGLWKTY